MKYVSRLFYFDRLQTCYRQPSSTRSNAAPVRSLLRALVLLVFAATSAPAVAVDILHEFFSPDGSAPSAELIKASDGNFYGTMSFGGANGHGTVFRMTPDGTHTTLASFAGTNGKTPVARLLEGSDGNFYGTTQYGGNGGNRGTVFRMRPDGTLTTLVDFNDSDTIGFEPVAGLIEDGSGKFYGTTRGGPGGSGTVFRINPDDSLTTLQQFSGRADFIQTTNASLILGSDGNFYGTDLGFPPLVFGRIFQMTPAGELTFPAQFNNSNGAFPSAELIEASDGNFYGTTRFGGDSDRGTVFRMSSAGVITTLVHFNETNGSQPLAGLVEYNGNFYGTTSRGGGSGQGTVFRVGADGSGFITLLNFDTDNGRLPVAGLVEDGGIFYGTTQGGGSGDLGTVFRISADGSLTTVFSSSSDGGSPSAALIEGRDGNLYGTTITGGSDNNGTVFRRAPDGTVTPLVNFNGSNGRQPYAGLLEASDGNFYGTTRFGGDNDEGTVFRMSPSGSLTTLVHFEAGNNGSHPMAELIEGSDGFLYGTTRNGGASLLMGDFGGTAFKMTFNGNLTTFALFRDSQLPAAPLLEGSDGLFYGTTRGTGGNGGSEGDFGSVFRIRPSTGAMTTLVFFNLADDPRGGSPLAGLIEGSDGNFYGTTTRGSGPLSEGDAVASRGTIFRMSPDGAFTTLLRFEERQGRIPNALIQGSDGNFYGTTQNGANGGLGTVFRMTPDGTLTTLEQFTVSTGQRPAAGLLEASDGLFYGTTIAGRNGNSGTIFRLPPTNDYGDALDPGYPTLLANDGARHTVGSLMLGNSIDAEANGQPNSGATGDDIAGTDDEDGVTFPDLIAGASAEMSLDVTAPSGAGMVDAWVDFNTDGVWSSDEQIADDVMVGQGNNLHSFAVPIDAVPGNTFARVRLSEAGVAAPGGAAPNGEVEDYLVNITADDDGDVVPTVTLGIDNVQINEDGSAPGSAIVTASLDDPFDSGAVTVNLSFGGTAGGSDFTAATSISIPAGDTSASTTLTATDDNLFEGNETVIASIAGATNATPGTPASVSTTIIDNEPQPTTTLSVSGSPFAENGGVATVTATLSGLSANATTIPLTFGGTASPGDYTASSTQITIPAEATSGQITLTGVDDNLFEGNETVTISGAGSSVNAIISDNDVAPPPPTASLSLSGSPFAENGGVATVTATLSGPSGSATTIPLTFGGTASPGDYTASSTQITIPAGATSGQITLTGVDDNLFEGNETVSISGAGFSVNATIADDETPPTISLFVANDQIPENAGTVTVNISLSAPANVATPVALAYSGSATRNRDFSAPNSVAIPARAASASFQIIVTDDALNEPNESIDITASPNSGGAAGRLSLSLIDDDAAPVVPVANLSIDNTTLAEDGGSATVTATLNQPGPEPVTLSFEFAGDAQGDTDYSASASSLTIPAGETSAALELTAIDDFIDEPDESIAVTLTEADNADLGDQSMVTTAIIDDDGAPSVRLNAGAGAIAENGGQTQITVTLSNPASQGIDIVLAVGGPSTPGTDFELADTTLSFAAGATQATTTLTGLDDTAHEPDELVIIALADTGAADTGLPASIGVALTDDDAPAPGAVAEDQSGPVTDTTAGPDARQVPVLAFGLRNPNVNPALLDQFSATVLPAPGRTLVGQARLYLDSNGDGQIQDGEPLVAQTAQVQPGGTVVFELAAPLSIGGGQTLNFVVLADIGG